MSEASPAVPAHDDHIERALLRCPDDLDVGHAGVSVWPIHRERDSVPRRKRPTRKVPMSPMRIASHEARKQPSSQKRYGCAAKPAPNSAASSGTGSTVVESTPA